MKKLVMLLIVIAAMAMMVPMVGAQGPSVYDSSIQVQNLDAANTANIVVEFYNQDGTIAHSFSDTVSASGSNTYFPLSVAAGFDGSVVVSSDREVAAIVNVIADNFAFGSSYGGFDGGAEVISLPLIMRGNSGFNTWFNVQNAGGTAATINVDYADSACAEGPITIQPGAAHTFDQATFSCLGSTYVGAATVTGNSGSQLVATVMEAGSQAPLLNLLSYNGFTTGSTELVAPLVQFNNSGFTSGFSIQNAGGTATDVTVSFTPGAGNPGTACTETISIAPGSSQTFGLFAFTLTGSNNTTCTRGERFIGSAEVTTNSASQDLVGIVNQINFAYFGSAYNAIDPAAATNTVVMPLIMGQNSGFFTTWNLANVGGSSTNVSCTYSNSAVTSNQTLGAGEAWTLDHNNLFGGTYVGSATCTADGAGIIVAVVNEFTFTNNADLLFTYNAVNR